MTQAKEEESKATITGNREINLEILEKIRALLRSLPEKQKTRYATKEAVGFLYEEIQSALNKNYSMEEISELLRSSGWEIQENSLKYFWRLFRHEEKRNDTSTSKDLKRLKSKKDEKKLTPKRQKNKQNEEDHKAETESADLLSNALNSTENMSQKGKREKSSIKRHSKVTGNSGSGDVEEVSEECSPKAKDVHFELPPDTEEL